MRPISAPLLSAGFLSVADQSLLSLSNLVLGLLLARSVEPDSFGLYVVLTVLSLIVASVQQALLVEPMLVFVGQHSAEGRSRYLRTLDRLQFVLSFSLVALLALALLLMTLSSWSPDILRAFGALTVAILPIQAHAYYRARLFALLRPGSALLADSVLAVTTASGALWLDRASLLGPSTALLLMGMAALGSALFARLLGRLPVTGMAEDFMVVVSRHWGFGRWILATSCAYWCSGQALALFASILIGTAAAGTLKAYQYLMAPLLTGLTGLQTLATPVAAARRAAFGPESARQFLARCAFGFGGLATVYSVLLLSFASWLMVTLYLGRYPVAYALLCFLMLEAVISSISRAYVIRAKLSEDTRSVFLAYSISSVVSVVGACALAWSFGLAGMAASAPLAALTVLLVLRKRLLSTQNRSPLSHPVSQRPAGLGRTGSLDPVHELGTVAERHP